jgi:hypothetical protein
MRLRYLSIVASFALACSNNSTHVSAPFVLTVANCPTLPTTPPLKAHVTIQGQATPCELTVSQAPSAEFPSGAYTASGDCPNVPAQSTPVILDWYVNSPTAGKVIILAESSGTAPLAPTSTQQVRVPFDQPLTVRAKATDDPSVQDRFNCDRTGVYACDGDPSVDPNAPDTDTCSNLEEYCMNTLFIPNHIDTCP